MPAGDGIAVFLSGFSAADRARLASFGSVCGVPRLVPLPRGGVWIGQGGVNTREV